MKKFAALLLAAVVMSLGLVSASGTASNASSVCPKAPYTGCVKTYVWGSHPQSVVHVNKRTHTYHLSSTANVGAGSGARATGYVTFVLRRNGNVIWNRMRSYPGASVSGYLTPGRYELTMNFKPKAHSVLARSSRTYGFVVKK